jgi:hypothetical protein
MITYNAFNVSYWVTLRFRVHSSISAHCARQKTSVVQPPQALALQTGCRVPARPKLECRLKARKTESFFEDPFLEDDHTQRVSLPLPSGYGRGQGRNRFNQVEVTRFPDLLPHPIHAFSDDSKTICPTSFAPLRGSRSSWQKEFRHFICHITWTGCTTPWWKSNCCVHHRFQTSYCGKVCIRSSVGTSVRYKGGAVSIAVCRRRKRLFETLTSQR